MSFLGYDTYVPCTYAPITIDIYCIHQAKCTWFYMLPSTLWDGHSLQFYDWYFRFIDFLRFMELVKWKSQDSKPGFSDGGVHVLFMITFTSGNSASLKEILGLERTKMKICLCGMTVWQYPETAQWAPLELSCLGWFSRFIQLQH